MLLQVDSPIPDSSEIGSKSLSLPIFLNATSTLNSMGILDKIFISNTFESLHSGTMMTLYIRWAILRRNSFTSLDSQSAVAGFGSIFPQFVSHKLLHRCITRRICFFFSLCSTPSMTSFATNLSKNSDSMNHIISYHIILN